MVKLGIWPFCPPNSRKSTVYTCPAVKPVMIDHVMMNVAEGGFGRFSSNGLISNVTLHCLQFQKSCRSVCITVRQLLNQIGWEINLLILYYYMNS